MTMTRSTHLAYGLLLALVVMTSSGCGNANPTGTVAGKVAYNGKPVAAGDVNFRSEKGAGASAKIKDGAFKIDGPLPVGEYSIFVNPPRPEPQAPGTPPVSLPPFDVPAKFQDAASSGLKVTVKGGANEIPVEIKD